MTGSSERFLVWVQLTPESQLLLLEIYELSACSHPFWSRVLEIRGALAFVHRVFGTAVRAYWTLQKGYQRETSDCRLIHRGAENVWIQSSGNSWGREREVRRKSSSVLIAGRFDFWLLKNSRSSRSRDLSWLVNNVFDEYVVLEAHSEMCEKWSMPSCLNRDFNLWIILNIYFIFFLRPKSRN